MQLNIDLPEIQAGKGGNTSTKKKGEKSRKSGNPDMKRRTMDDE